MASISYNIDFNNNFLKLRPQISLRFILFSFLSFDSYDIDFNHELFVKKTRYFFFFKKKYSISTRKLFYIDYSYKKLSTKDGDYDFYTISLIDKYKNYHFLGSYIGPEFFSKAQKDSLKFVENISNILNLPLGKPTGARFL